MNFDLILGADSGLTTTVECNIERSVYDVGYDNVPVIGEFNRYHSSDKHVHWTATLDELTILIADWNVVQADISMAFPCVDIPESTLYPWRALKQVHEYYINPLQAHCIKLYKILNDQHTVEYIESVVIIFNKLCMFRNISGDIISNKNHQSFSLRFSNDHKLLTDDDAANFTMARNPGDIFLAPTAIAYDYDNLGTERMTHDNYEYTIVKMSPETAWYSDIGQQVSHNGDLVFWCGDSRTHADAVADINDSITQSWDNYKIRKTDLRDKWNMLTMGMIKIGSFDTVPGAIYNKVVGYVRK